MALTEKQKRHLRGLGHALKPVVIVGAAGLTDGVRAEIEQAIDHHELIKVRLNADDRGARQAMIEAICDASRAVLIHRIGHVGLFYRRNPDKPRIALP